MLVILKTKISLVSIKKSLYYCRPPFTRRVSSHRVLYLKFLSTCNICIIYLHLTEAWLKVTLMFQFCHSENPSDVTKYFQFHLYIFLKKNLLVNKYKKQTSYKVNKSLFFDVMKNGHIFPSKVCHFKFDHRFLFCREMGNISAWEEVRLLH